MQEKGVPKFLTVRPLKSTGEVPSIQVVKEPNPETGSLVTYEKEEPYSLLHGLTELALSHTSSVLGDPVELEKENARYLIEQLIDSGVWDDTYKEGVVSSLSNYMDEEESRALVKQYEKEAQFSLKHHYTRGKLERLY